MIGYVTTIAGKSPSEYESDREPYFNPVSPKDDRASSLKFRSEYATILVDKGEGALIVNDQVRVLKIFLSNDVGLQMGPDNFNENSIAVAR